MHNMASNVRLPLISLLMAISLIAGYCVFCDVAFAQPSENPSLEAGVMSTQPVVDVQAQKTLKSKGVKFNLKKNKAVTMAVKQRGISDLHYSLKLSNIKVTNLGNGYKQVSLRYSSSLKTRITKAKQKKVLAALKSYGYKWDDCSGDCCVFFCDFYTGKTLSGRKNGVGAVVERNVVKDEATKTFVSADGAWFRLAKRYVVDYKFKFKDSYDGLCVGFCPAVCYNSEKNKAARDWASDAVQKRGSKYTLYDTSWYKLGKKKMTAMRIR